VKISLILYSFFSIRFGEVQDYLVRCFVLYNGIHYDPLHMPAPGIPGFNYTAFSILCEKTFEQAKEIADQAHKSGTYTDTDNYTLKCNTCGAKLKGNTDLVKHSKETSHTDFEEYRSK